MDFGGGFATGIAVGIGSGIATGMASGQTQAKKQLQNYIEENGIEIQDRYGKPIKLDEFMDRAVTTSSGCCAGNRNWAWVMLAVGLAAAMAISVAIFVLRS